MQIEKYGIWAKFSVMLEAKYAVSKSPYLSTIFVLCYESTQTFFEIGYIIFFYVDFD